MLVINKLNKQFLIAAVIALSLGTINAREREGVVFNPKGNRILAGCSAPQSSSELAVNNVRTIIYGGSDMWWDLFGTGKAFYVVPKVEERSRWTSSNFSANVWFGGLDLGGQLKVAAQTYRQGGIDFWTGPLSTVDATISQDMCNQFDKIYKIKRSEVDEFVLSGGSITSNIKAWPGNGDISINQDQQLAPFFDKDGDAIYTPEAGDYPYYDVNNNAGKDNLGVCKARVFGDETLWWVYNDNGGVHQATGGKAIGLEVRAQAFAFKTTDEINNMTFYSYQIINRSSFELTNTYMTVWTDADVGYYGDDYIGCDVKRGLGYVYNSDNFDETVGGTNGYGSYVPAMGCDFFQGPVNTTDGIDNNGNGTTDEPGEQMGMSKFLYFNNSFPGVPIQTTDPNNATQYYQYMTGFWKDGTPFTCGGNAYGGTTPTSFVYPAETYTSGACGATPWSESGTAGDRRFMQSSGPFNLKAGAVNYVTFGLPWARTSTTDQKASIALLKIADDKAQALFDNCFKVLSGPEAPDVTIQEMNNELILYFANKPASNNYLNLYKELDVSILVDTVSSPTPHYKNVDRYYHFEGFKVYQLKNEAITQEELTDPSKAKLAFSCDVKNGVQRLINYEYDATTGGDLPKVKAEGSDNGIQSTFHFTKDLFSSSIDQKVVNNKTYYFLTVAYGYNQYGEYKEDTPWSTQNSACIEGQKRPYLEGRKSKKAYGIPHIPDPEKSGSVANSFYGYGPKITRIEGTGNGGNNMDLTQSSIDEIFNNGGRVQNITYENGRGPIGVKVVDPLNVPNSTFSFYFIKKNYYKTDDAALQNACVYSIDNKSNYKSTYFGALAADSITWVLKDNTTQKEYAPCKSIKVGEEFYFGEIGLSINVGQVGDVANVSVVPKDTIRNKVVQPGDFIEGTMSFADPTKNWLTGVKDVDGTSPQNWIRSGGFKEINDLGNSDYGFSSTAFIDPAQIFETVLEGTWAPYCLTAATKVAAANGSGPSTSAAPAISGVVNHVASQSPFDIRALSSVDVIFTTDKSKWTKVMVVEECDEQAANPTGSKKLEPKRKLSVDKQGIPTGSPGCVEAEAVMDTLRYSCSWFPGYAINIETGERLNIAFGEDSYQSSNNGNDMMWNPTSNMYQSGYAAFGGRHYIYIFGHSRSSSRYSGVPLAGGQDINGKLIGSGTYNDFVDLVGTYKFAFKVNNNALIKNVWSDVLWVNIPLLENPNPIVGIPSKFAFSNPANMPCDAKVRLRVKKAYRACLSGSFYTNAPAYVNSTLDCKVIPPQSNSANYTQLSTDTVAGAVNRSFGYYTFSTADIFTEINNADKSKSALDLINVVPNPYYAYSTYEQNRADNRVRITNLPNKCKIKIFTLNGTLVRTFDRDVTGQEDLNLSSSEFVHSKRLPFQDWDLKNQNGISVASGLYIIHVDVPGVGEKILKWFGVMRPLDLQSY